MHKNNNVPFITSEYRCNEFGGTHKCNEFGGTHRCNEFGGTHNAMSLVVLKME